MRHGPWSPLTLWATCAMACLAVLGLLAGLSVGEWGMSPRELLLALLSGPPRGGVLDGAFVVWDLRLPRTLGALLSGMALGCSGVVFQGVLRNRLAEPYTLGVASGAAFGAAVSILAGINPSLGALMGSFLSLGAVLALSLGCGAHGMIMSGVVVSSVLSSALTLVKALSGEKVSAIVIWLMGSFSASGWGGVWLSMAGALVGLVTSTALNKELDLFASGADPQILGVNDVMVRALALLGASSAAALVVGQFGVIGFVGLIAPHMGRLILGPSTLRLSVLSALVGGGILVWADVACRVLGELPVGVMTSLLGGPLFLWLMWRGGGGA